jgi:hypothetical protein
VKKFILAITVAAFTVGAYANDCASKDASACTADKEKAAASCPANKGQCPAAGTTAKKDAGKKIVQSPKGEQANKS